MRPDCEFPTGLTAMETPQTGLNCLYLRVRGCVRLAFWKLHPQVWKGLWITEKTPVKRLSLFVPQGVSEAFGYAIYQGLFNRTDSARLWTTRWNTAHIGGFRGVTF